MYAYLSRKVTLFNQNELCSIADHGVEGLRSIGGHDGLLKVIQINGTIPTHQGGNEIGRSEDPALIQTLEGHSGNVINLAWNATFQKLSSTDENGLTIVWRLQDGVWYEDMVNNRNDCFVTDMKWSPDGELICIAYNDGTVMVGSVEGSRLWGIEAAEPIFCIEWSPDNKNIIFVTERNTIKVYDKVGNHVRTMTSGIDTRINTMDWFGDVIGKRRRDTPTLAIVSTSGKIRLTKGLETSNEVILVSALQRGICRWNRNGNILALCGQKICEEEEGKEEESILVVEFYNAKGTYLYQLLITQNENLVDFQWDVSGLELIVTTERCIYFVHVRPPHRYTALNSANTLVYECNESENIIFLNMKHKQRVEKSFGKVTKIYGNGGHCLLISEVMEAQSADWQHNCSKLVFCDEVGSIWSTKKLKIHPDHVSMSDNFAVVSDHRNVYVFTFNSSTFHSYPPSYSGGMERMFDVNDKSLHPSKAHSVYNVNNETGDPKITAICTTATLGLFAKEDNQILIYSFPNITKLNQITLECGIPQMIKGNSDSTKFSIIDVDNTFQILNLETRSNSEVGVRSYLKPSGVDHAWAMGWSADDPNSCVILDEDSVYEIDLLGENMNKVEILPHTNGYLFDYSNLEITLVLLDDILLHPHSMSDYCAINLPSKALEDARQMMMKEESNFLSRLSRSSHKQLWKLLAHQSLEKLDFHTAELAFVLCEDYNGVSLTEKMSSLKGEDMKRAEILKFLGRYIEAEEKYLDIDRLDLAIQMNIDTGDWTRVRSLVDQSKLSDDALCAIWSKMAEAFADQRQYDVAAEYYKNAKNYSLAIECLIHCQDYDSMKDIIKLLNAESSGLEDITKRLLSNGLYKLAISCQKKVSFRLAMDTCVNLNMWEEAALVANEGELRPQLEKIAKKKADDLLEQNNFLNALVLCQSVDLTSDAAKILCQLAESRNTKHGSDIPHHTAKKIFILAAKQVERHRDKTIDMSSLKLKGGKAANKIASSIEQFMDDQHCSEKSGKATMGVFDNAWKNAAAHHYIMAAHDKFQNGKAEAAMIMAIRCCEYIDILNPMEVYSLIALSSYISKFYEVCSMSLSRLRTLKNIDKTSSESAEKLAFEIFTQQKPVNDSELLLCYMECLETGESYHACTISGKNIIQKRALQCRFCHYYMLEEEARERRSCALCHGDIRDAEMVILE